MASKPKKNESAKLRRGVNISIHTVSFPVFMMIALSSQAFELATGDYLFEPHSGEDYSRDEGIAGTSSSCPFSVLSSYNCTASILSAIFRSVIEMCASLVTGF